MKYHMRILSDKIFTAMTVTSIVLLVAILIGLLGPMILKGSTAVFFSSTVEFRRMQFDLHNRGNKAKLNEDVKQSKLYRAYVYERIDEFKKGIDTSFFITRAKQIYRQYGKELKYSGIERGQRYERQKFARQIRRNLTKAFKSLDKAEITQILYSLNQYRTDERLANTSAVKFFELADEYKALIDNFDLSKRQQYAQSLSEVEQLVLKLFGPRALAQRSAMAMDNFGATRMDLANELLEKIIWKEQWVQQNPGESLIKIRTRRSEEFAGTALESIFPYIEKNFTKIVRPQFTIYWQYFFDDSTSGHYFGGVGPEILGTLLLTALAMIFVFPLGVTSAAYLVECASDSIAIRIIRMCINTLAGVPSIIFGLFGLAFFVLFLFPLLGLPAKPSVLAASLTLAVLTLPVMIRASEEAIRSVPSSYKEASLGLGASRFRTFIKVTLPAAMPGILTGVILSLSRVAGETAPILFTGACAFGSIPKSLFSQTRTLSYGSYDIAVGDKIGMLVPHKQYGMVVTLILLIICLNVVAIVFRAKIFRKLKGH